MSVEFEDNTMKAIEALADGLSAAMYEAGAELQTQVRRNSRVDTGVTKGSYDYKVRGSVFAGTAEVQVGSDMENAVWEEYGTGEYALHGDGRKGGWVYQNEKGDYYHTYGKTPNQPLTRAFQKTAPKIKRHLAEVVKVSWKG